MSEPPTAISCNHVFIGQSLTIVVRDDRYKESCLAQKPGQKKDVAFRLHRLESIESLRLRL